MEVCGAVAGAATSVVAAAPAAGNVICHNLDNFCCSPFIRIIDAARRKCSFPSERPQERARLTDHFISLRRKTIDEDGGSNCSNTTNAQRLQAA